MKARGRISGYTLVEVLVAFVILAMALTVLLQIFSGGLRSVSISSDYARAVAIAESQLAEAGVAEALRPGQELGDTDSKFTWTRTVTERLPVPGSVNTSSFVKAYNVTVSVEWANAGRIRQVNLSTTRLVVQQEYES